MGGEGGDGLNVLRPSVPTSLRLPFDLRRVLRKQARAEHRSVSSLVVFVLDSYAKANNLFEIHKLPPRLARVMKRPEEADE